MGHALQNWAGLSRGIKESKLKMTSKLNEYGIRKWTENKKWLGFWPWVIERCWWYLFKYGHLEEKYIYKEGNVAHSFICAHIEFDEITASY